VRTFCLALFAAAAFSQSAKTPPAFEAADVHVSPPTRNEYRRGPMNRNGLYEMTHATMVDLIAIAYGVENDKVVGGPTWLEMDRYDVIARPPAKATQDEKKAMLQTLLADRFKLVVHNDNRPILAYALTVAKPGLLKKSDGSGDSRCTNKYVGVPPAVSETCPNVTIAKFAEQLPDTPFAGIYLNDHVVVDQTGLEGAWDLSYRYTYRLFPGQGETLTLFDALEKQLGLKLVFTTIPQPVIVVESVNEKPTDNLPNVSDILKAPPLPTEFEVADVKPSGPESRGMRFQIRNGGRVNMTGVTLKFIIQQAWDLPEDLIFNAPKWLGEDRFDIIAKATTEDPANGPQIDYDNVWGLLRELLKDRFKLETHTENRVVNAFNLVAVKPKLQKADSASRTWYKEGPGPDGKDPRNKNPLLSRLVSVQNMTMAQFCAQLPQIASGYVHTPVVDATGLEGSWDFTLSFSPVGMDQFVARNGRGGNDVPGGIAQASDPSGALPLFEALEKQLGLKLETVKRSVPVLVIDHVEQKPVDN
jgi:uncharacterized protein (TIGR03435 family)